MLVTVATGLAVAAPASAATFTVNTTSDALPVAGDCAGTSQCSLRQAIAAASAGDTVSLPASATPYAVALGAIDVDNAITISGAGANTTTIDGSGNGDAGIFTIDGSATFSGVTISDGNAGSSGEGGALDIDSGNVELDNDTLSYDTAADGGAIELTSDGGLTINDSTLGPGDVAVANGTEDGFGGAIDNNGSLAATITDSTISGDSATGGGVGGGISTEDGGRTTLSFDTIAFNSATGTGAAGGDLYSDNGGNDPDGFTIGATIVADGAAPTGGDCNSNDGVNGGYESGGYNLTDGIAATGTAACNFTQSTDLLGDARLGPLADNGGPTETEALAAGSPAIEQIPAGDCIATDQRGYARPEGTDCDIGALEAGYGETVPQWSVAHDFLASPNDANPSRDSFGNTDVWSYDETPLGDVGTPADYTLMPDFGVSSCPNLNVWSDPSGFPELDFNAGTITDQCFTTVTLPGQTLFMSPNTDADGIVAWTSPVSGTISVAGSFVSMDPNGGSGTTWDVADGSATLASGTNDRGGSGNFDPAPFSVAKGDTLYFILGPSASQDASYDTTELNLTITEAGAPSPSADLALSASAPQTVSPGAAVTDKFTVTDNGPDTSEGVTFVDTLPADATYQSANPSQGECFPPSSGVLTCNLGPLSEGDQATVSVTLQTQADFVGPLSNPADVSAATPDPNNANNSATATTTVALPCTTSMTIDAVEVLAGCITDEGNGIYQASGDTHFGDGASIVDTGTQTPASLVLDPAAHTISIAPAVGGGAQSGELEADGVDVATGDLVIHTQAVTDPISGIAGSASVTGIGSVDLALSGWTFTDVGLAPTAYLAPSADGGGAIADGQLALPSWLGDALKFGALVTEGLVPGVSGELAVQANSSGQLSVIDGGVSFKATVLGDSSIQLANAELQYERAGDEWSGSAILGFAKLVELNVNGVISEGKLDDLTADFSCSTSKICGTGNFPTLGAILDIKDIDLSMINLQGIDYTPPPTIGSFRMPIACVPSKFRSCPPPEPAPQVDGAVIVGIFGDRIIAGGDFDYLLDGQFTASGGVGLAPLYGGTFSDPPPLTPGQSATNVVDNLLNSGHAGVELGSAAIDFTPPGLLQATGTMFLPPLPFPVQFLKGTISIGIDPPHFTGEGTEELVVPSYVPVIGGDSFGAVQALISDEAAAAEASLPQYCVSVDLGFHTYTECTPKITFLAAYDWSTGKVTVDLNGGNINDYATVPQVSSSSAAGSDTRFVRVPSGKQLASFTIHSTRGTPDVELISPRGARQRRALTLTTSRKLHNRTGAIAWVDRKAHREGFLVELPSGGTWTVKRLRGPKIGSVTVTVPRHAIHSTIYPHAVERASNLPSGTVSSDKDLTLNYNVPGAGPGTTVELWAGTGPHGAGGVMIGDGLPPSGAATWKLAGLASGRYWPYAIVNQNGIPVSIQYWPNSVEVVNASAPATPTGVQASQTDEQPNALSPGQVYIGWNAVPNATTYAVTATPAGGGSPVRDAVLASQVADVLTLAPGDWSVTVQSVAAGDQASLPSTPAAITVP